MEYKTVKDGLSEEYCRGYNDAVKAFQKPLDLLDLEKLEEGTQLWDNQYEMWVEFNEVDLVEFKGEPMYLVKFDYEYAELYKENRYYFVKPVNEKEGE